jgi:putative phosphoribosyl transferase
LDAPLEIFVARKIGAPGQPEFGIGAIAEGGVTVIDRRTARALGLSDADLQGLVQRESVELQRRVERYRGGRPLPKVSDRSVVLVDDGLATGSTAAAALTALRALHQPRRLVLAAPVCASETARRLSSAADAVICVLRPDNLSAIGLWYADFTQTSDEEVLQLLADAAEVRR